MGTALRLLEELGLGNNDGPATVPEVAVLLLLPLPASKLQLMDSVPTPAVAAETSCALRSRRGEMLAGLTGRRGAGEGVLLGGSEEGSEEGSEDGAVDAAELPPLGKGGSGGCTDSASRLIPPSS